MFRFFFFLLVVSALFFSFLRSRWSFVDIPLLIFSCPADHVPDVQSRILYYAVVCPNVTGRTKKRIPQSKRARAGSLALVDSLFLKILRFLLYVCIEASGEATGVFFSPFVYSEMSLFPSIFCTIAVFSMS